MRLLIQPGVEKTWRDFVKNAPGGSIALDGYVTEGPRYNPQGPWVNFNHHAGVSRLETRATCAQVLIAIRQGLVQYARRQGKEPCEMSVYVNDCDEDVCLSVFLLQNRWRVVSPVNPLLNRLVFMEDMLDTTGGSYVFPDGLTSMEQLLWVFEPYHAFRASGRIDKNDADQFRSVIHNVGVRIEKYLVGEGGRIEPDTRYERLWIGKCGWVMMKEVGANARLGIFRDNFTAFLSVRERPDGTCAYSLGRASQFVRFPIPKILKALNRAEGLKSPGMGFGWGGSDMIAGSPRGIGSRLKPDEVAKIIDDAI